MSNLRVGQPYPEMAKKSNGASHYFLCESNTVVCVVPNMSEQEKSALIHGDVEAGLLVKDHAIMFLWRFLLNKKTVLVLNGCFDAWQVHSPLMDDIENGCERLLVVLHIVDGTNNKLEGVRAVTLPPALSINFLSAIQGQLAVGETALAKAAYAGWSHLNPQDLMKTTSMYRMSSVRAATRPRLTTQARASIKKNF